jgi:hypothetical protein
MNQITVAEHIERSAMRKRIGLLNGKPPLSPDDELYCDDIDFTLREYADSSAIIDTLKTIERVYGDD